VGTLEIAKTGFYSPKMLGSYSLKDIVKAIPTEVNYTNTNSLGSGSDAQIAWFICTDKTTSETEKHTWHKKLLEYCSQDTLAMYDLLKYLYQ
jgi:hypothetical protein